MFFFWGEETIFDLRLSATEFLSVFVFPSTRSKLSFQSITWDVLCVCVIKYICPAAYDPSGSWQLLSVYVYDQTTNNRPKSHATSCYQSGAPHLQKRKENETTMGKGKMESTFSRGPCPPPYRLHFYLPPHPVPPAEGCWPSALPSYLEGRALGRLVGLDIYVDGCRLWRVASALVGSNHHNVHAFIIIYYSASAQLTLPCDHLLARLITPHELAINGTHHERPFAF